MFKKRERIDRVYWGWVEDNEPGSVTDADVKTAYRLTAKQHKPNTCRKNCKSNPNCLSGFGEQALNQTIDKDAEVESFMSTKLRVPKTYVGLKNLGNTCYINSLLQLWFHNIPFREAVYGWNALEDKQEIAKHLEVYNRPVEEYNYEPSSSIAHLQYLFCEMQFGLTKYCDPEAFCRSLSIDVELQQDAQEFNKLYMQRLEESFQLSSNEKTRRLTQDQFRGEYSYVTTCCNCSKESERQSYFYELELKVKKCNSILDSLKEFLSEEPLTGENKYFCSNCNEKHNAFTRIRLEELPPVLQLQLLRYEIDSTIGTRRKIHSAIQFPDVLDMSSHLGKPPNTFNYKLIAVLMHGGSTAYSGHYYAHINTNDGWHVFDDITVKKERNLNLASEENLIPAAERKSCGPKLKGFHSSSSVYMLVYRRINKAESFNAQSSADSGKPSVVDDVSRKFLSSRSGGRLTRDKSRKENLKAEETDIDDLYVDGVNIDHDVKVAHCITHLTSEPHPVSPQEDEVTECEKPGERKEGEQSRDASIFGKEKKVRDDFVFDWVTKLKNKDILTDSQRPTDDLNKLVWSKFTSIQFPDDDVGEVYVVFDKKILNHPRLGIFSDWKPTRGDEKLMNGLVADVGSNGKFRGGGDTNVEQSMTDGNLSLHSHEQNFCRDTHIKTVKNNNCTDQGSASTANDVTDSQGNGEPAKIEVSLASDDVSYEEKIDFRSDLDEAHWKMLPGYLKKAILRSRHKVRSSFNSQLIEIDSRIDIRDMVKTISESIMPGSDANGHEFIDFEWLRSLTKKEVSPIDNSSLVCKHGKLDVNKSCSYKAISTKTADFLYEKFGGGPRLGSDSLCRPCVESKARQVRLQIEVAKDSKLLLALSRQLIERHHKAYWVGKRTLRRWTNYVLDELDDDGMDDDEDPDPGAVVKECSGDRRDVSDVENTADRSKNDFDEEINESFNDDIICVHDDLTVEENDRKLISEVAWNILQKYFPKAKPFERDHLPCVPCQNLASQDKEHRNAARRNAVLEKESLKSLFEKKQTLDLNLKKSPVYVVNSAFLNDWRKYIRSAQRQTMLEAPDSKDLISPLLCETHGQLMYDPETDVDRFSSLTDKEWTTLKSFYPTEKELKIVKQNNGSLIPSIGVCQECLTRRRLAEDEEDLQNSYLNATVYVWKVDTSPEECDSDDNDESPGKRRKLNSGKSVDVMSAVPACKKPEQVRRSARARQPKKGRKMFVVNKFTTLKDLKIMIFNKFTVMPTDQHLSLNGEDLDVLKESLQLSDAEATLMRLKVKPNDVLHLVADEPAPGKGICETEGFMLPEAGFKGTELGGR